MKLLSKKLLASLLLILIILILAGGLLLKNGVRIESFKKNGIELQGFSLQWREKLDLRVNHINITPLMVSTGKSASPLMDGVDKFIFLMKWLDILFEEISAPEIIAGDSRANLYFSDSIYRLDLISPKLEGKIRIQPIGEDLTVECQSLKSRAYSTDGYGKIKFNMAERTGTGQFTINLAGCMPVIINLDADEKQLSFHGHEDEPITNITPFVELFGLDVNIQPWITDYLKGSRFILKVFKGTFPWDNPGHILHTLYAEARVENCQYTFAQGLEPIKTTHTDLLFNKGILTITPYNSSLYGQNTENSWLDINFSDIDSILLTAHIKTHATYNHDIITLLRHYNIPLNILQKSGSTAADLTITVNLNREETSVKGQFQVDEGTFSYNGKEYLVTNGSISLEDSEIAISGMTITSEGLFSAFIKGTIAAGRGYADLAIVPKEFSSKIGDYTLILDHNANNPKLHYRQSPEGSSIEITESYWKLNGLRLHLSAIDTPFSMEELSVKLKSAGVTIDSLLDAEITGSLSLETMAADLKCLLHKFNRKGFQLESDPTPLQLTYNRELAITLPEKSQWSLNNIPVTIFPSTIYLKKNKLSLSLEKFIYGDFFQGKLHGVFDPVSLSSRYIVEHPQFYSDALKNLLMPETTFTVDVDSSGKYLKIRIPLLDLDVITGDDRQWTARFNDLKVVADHSMLLQRYGLNNGRLSIYSKDGGAPYRFVAETLYEYPVFVVDNTPINEYLIKGQTDGSQISGTINHILSFHYGKDLSIQSTGIAYNIPELMRLSDEYLHSEENGAATKKDFNVYMLATDSGLFFSPESQAIADTLTLNYKGGKVKADIFSGKGTIEITKEDDVFSLVGKDLDDRFMNSLSPDAYLRNGTMSLAAKGKFDDFSALVKINDTVLLNYATTNNILAMVNTIPALITFSLPQYSSSGLQVKSIVAGMQVKDGVAAIESASLDSPQLSINGTGWINFTEKTIDMDLNLITQSKKNINKIPLVGYILAGKEKHPSITIKVTGDLQNPEVEHKVFREVATIPFGILYRTLALPSYLVSPLLEENKDQQQ